MKKILLLLLIAGVFGNIRAQYSITGKVLIKDGEGLEAHVKLFAENNSVESIMQTEKGIFTFSNLIKNKSYYVVASCVGYTTDTIKIERIREDLNLGTMFLKPSYVNLGEVVVVGSSMTFRNGVKRIIPNKFHKKNSTDAMVMLDKMNLSRINVDPLTKSLTLNGGGNVKVMLNGREVSATEISSLSPSVIQRIEYHDTPEARYGNADVVLDFITKEDNTGGRIYLSLWQGLLTAFGEDYISLKFNRKNSQFSLDYNLSYRNWKKLSRDYDEDFYLSNETISRAEKGHPGRFKYDNHNVRFNYNYQKGQKIVNLSLGTALQHAPYKEWKSDIQYPKTTYDLYDNAKSSGVNPFTRLYIQMPIRQNQLYIATLSGQYNKGEYSRQYHEIDDKNKSNQFYSDANEVQKGYALSQLYENKQNWGTLTIGANFNQQFTTSDYEYTQNPQTQIHRTTMRLSNLYSYAQWGKGWNKLYTRAGIGLNQRWIHVGKEKHKTLQISPMIFMRYAISPKFELRYQGSVSNVMPTLSALSDYSQEIDFIQTQKGNPFLKPQIDFYNALVFNYILKKTAWGLYLNQTYSKSPIMESTYIENGRVIRTQENHRNFQNYNMELEYGGQPIGDFLSFKAYVGMKLYKSNGNQYTHSKTIPYYGGQISVYYKQFSLRWQFRKSTQDKFWGETFYRYEDGHMLSIGYHTNKISLSADVLNLFALKHISAQENYSNVGPYKRYEYLNETKNLIRLNLTLNLSYGKKYRELARRTDNRINSDSSIIKGEK